MHSVANPDSEASPGQYFNQRALLILVVVPSWGWQTISPVASD
jgi:hypothetical protein